MALSKDNITQIIQGLIESKTIGARGLAQHTEVLLAMFDNDEFRNAAIKVHDKVAEIEVRDFYKNMTAGDTPPGKVTRNAPWATTIEVLKERGFTYKNVKVAGENSHVVEFQGER